MIHAADNWKLSRPLAEACLPDVKRLCKGVSGGSGKVHECLRRKEAELSAECKEAEKKAEAAEAEDIRLKPELERVCSEAITVHCKDVAPGGGRVINCLIEKASTENCSLVYTFRMSTSTRPTFISFIFDCFSTLRQSLLRSRMT
eukprot:gene7173-8552_t